MQIFNIRVKSLSTELISLCFQECNNARTKIFKNLLLDHNKLKKSHRTLLSAKEQSEKDYASKLKTTHDEITRLQQELNPNLLWRML